MVDSSSQKDKGNPSKARDAFISRRGEKDFLEALYAVTLKHW